MAGRWIGLLGVLLAALASAAERGAAEPWDLLRAQYFGERPIAEKDGVIALDAPARAEDAAIVPVTIRDVRPADDPRRIRRLYLFVDRNPSPLAGIFDLSPRIARADLSTRVRVNEYTPIHAVAETGDGALHLASRYVKASGGCSAPAGKDAEAALARIGRMLLRPAGPAVPGEPLATQILISHPNNSGLQRDQITQLTIPPWYLREIVADYAGDWLLTARTTFTLSENPSLRFSFVPSGGGELEVQATDTREQQFHGAVKIPAGK